MIDEFFAMNALKDYFEKEKIEGSSLLLNDNECEAVISLLLKGKKEYLPLLLEKTDENLDRSAQIKSLFLGRIAAKDLIFPEFSKEDAIKHLENMKSPYAKGVLKEVK